jgi:hypothetical protein
MPNKNVRTIKKMQFFFQETLPQFWLLIEQF